MTIKTILNERQVQKPLTAISSTKEIMLKVNKNKLPYGNTNTLADKVINRAQRRINKDNKSTKRYAAIIDFKDLKVTKSTIITLTDNDKVLGKERTTAREYSFEVCDGVIHYGIATVYCTNYKVAEKALQKYLQQVSLKTGNLMQFSIVGRAEWKDGFTND